MRDSLAKLLSVNYNEGFPSIYTTGQTKPVFIVPAKSADSHTVYIYGFPWLYQQYFTDQQGASTILIFRAVLNKLMMILVAMFSLLAVSATVRCEESDFVCGQCIMDSGRDRLFEHQHKFSRNRPQTCIEFCHGSGYKYAGVQFGNQCFCGNSLPPASRITDSTECNMKCPGDKRYMCGGFDRMNVY